MLKLIEAKLAYLTLSIPVKFVFRSNQNMKNEKESPFTEKDQLELFLKLKNYVEINNSFLKKDLTIRYLSKKLHTNSNYLSKSVNAMGNKSFVQFINSYRIEFAKDMLLDEHYSKYTIQAISEKSGFNSTSAFYTAFKKETSIAPSAFIKKNKLSK